MGLKRQSNFELCKIIAIILVMLVHSTFSSLKNTELGIGVYLLAAFSVIGVNVFVMITGYFSTTPKKSGLINLAFICLFWMVIRVICRYFGGESIEFKHLFFITSSNWFIPCYIGLLFLTPLLNLFCNSVNKNTLLGGAFSLLLIEVWFDWLPPFPDMRIGTYQGYSILSFAILYLIARSIKIYGLPCWFRKMSPYIYVVSSILTAVLAYVLVQTGHKASFLYAYNSPLVILSSVSFLAAFENIHVESRAINHIAKSTLAVLLGHSAIFFLYTKQFKYIYSNYSGIQVVGYWVLAIAIVFCASVAIDQLRLLLYNPIEKMMKNIKNNNIFDLPDSKPTINGK